MEPSSSRAVWRGLVSPITHWPNGPSPHSSQLNKTYLLFEHPNAVKSLYIRKYFLNRIWSMISHTLFKRSHLKGIGPKRKYKMYQLKCFILDTFILEPLNLSIYPEVL